MKKRFTLKTSKPIIHSPAERKIKRGYFMAGVFSPSYLVLA